MLTKHINYQLDFFFVFVRYWRKNASAMKQHIGYSRISRKPMIKLGGKYYAVFSYSLGYHITT
jgi:hypothetical protein